MAYIDHRVPKPLALCLMNLYTTPPPFTPFTQLNKCGALLNGPHFSPAPAAAPAAAAASDPDTKAPQKLFKLPINLFQSSRKQMTKKGEWLKGARLIPIMVVMWLYWTPYKSAYIDHRVTKPPSLCLKNLYTTPSLYTTLTQLNKCGALLNGPHFSPAPAAPAASDPDTKAL